MAFFENFEVTWYLVTTLELRRIGVIRSSVDIITSRYVLQLLQHKTNAIFVPTSSRSSDSMGIFEFQMQPDLSRKKITLLWQCLLLSACRALFPGQARGVKSKFDFITKTPIFHSYFLALDTNDLIEINKKRETFLV